MSSTPRDDRRSGPKRTQFLVLGPQRSGTTVTYLTLRGHPNACGISDEVDPAVLFEQGVSAFTRNGVVDPAMRDRYAPALFEAIAFAESGPATLAGGMKIAIETASTARSVADALCGPLRHVRVVLTIREDMIAHYGSLKRAQATGQWHSWGKGGSTGGRLRLDPKEFAAHVRRYREIHQVLLGLLERRDGLLVRYEQDILGNLPGLAGRLFDYVGIPRLEPDWFMAQKVAPPVEDYIENLDELRARLESMD